VNPECGYRLSGIVVAVGLGLASLGVAYAQQGGQPGGGAGVLLGEVDKCVNGNETPTSGVSIGVAGSTSVLAKSDATGQFSLTLAPGQYTIQATADDGATALRPAVPVQGGASLDIGVLELAGGCLNNDAGAPAPAQATAQPTAAATATAEPATPTPAATAVPPTATPMPAPDESQPDQPSPDEGSDAG
jgi:hypothetical protein